MLTAARFIAISLQMVTACRRGASAIEYVILACGVALLILTTVYNVGSNLSIQYNAIGNTVTK